MSHVSNAELHIKTLERLEEACEVLGLEFRPNQKTYNWYGHHVGDYPLPKGFTAKDMGRCDHAIAVKGKPNAYEVGVCKRRDGKEGYLLQFDFFAGGNGLMQVIGEGAVNLRNEYAAAVARQDLRRKGFKIQRTVTPSGKIVMRATR